MSLTRSLVIAALIIIGAAGIGLWRWKAGAPARDRQALFDEITPVALTNCEVARYGDFHDGGYLSCKNLLPGATSVYSYGINASDRWGCDLSDLLKVPVHQYDCFNPIRPGCAVGEIFHDECVGPARGIESGRTYDTLEAQIARNGDAGKRLIVKLDVEGSEWLSLLGASDGVLDQIDQLSVEFHNLHQVQPQYIEAVRRLKRVFHIAFVHDNNWVCDPAAAPFPASAIEVLFVNKRLGVAGSSGAAPPPVHPLDAPNNQKLPDCQAAR